MCLSIVVCDNGWIPYENHCYWCSPNPDIFHNAVVRFKCIHLPIITDMLFLSVSAYLIIAVDYYTYVYSIIYIYIYKEILKMKDNTE